MANVIHRTTLEQQQSVHTPNYSPTTWIINPDLSDVEGVPKKYWKIAADRVVPMTQTEKDALAAGELAGQKKSKIREIDARTDALIVEKGFEYPAGSGQIMSLSHIAQTNANSLRQLERDGVLTFPFNLPLMDDSGFVPFANATELAAYYQAGAARKLTVSLGAEPFKVEVINATTKADLDSIEDTRT